MLLQLQNSLPINYTRNNVLRLKQIFDDYVEILQHSNVPLQDLNDPAIPLLRETILIARNSISWKKAKASFRQSRQTLDQMIAQSITLANLHSIQGNARLAQPPNDCAG